MGHLRTCCLLLIAVCQLLPSALVNADSTDKSASRGVYDYIVAGAGSAGCIVAERLSRNPAVRVLVVDSGTDQSKSIFTTPSLYRTASPPPGDQERLAEAMFSYEYPSKSQKVLYPRYALGGASAMNGNFIQRVNRADQAEWVSASGDQAWSFDNTDADWRSIETWNSSDPLKLHGTSGPITIQTFEERKVPIHDAIAGAMSAAFGVPIIPDSNLGNTEGVSLGARSIAAGPDVQGEGVRQDTWTRVLKKAVETRPNLTLRAGCKVTRVELKQRGNKEPVAQKLHFVCKGVSEEARARREIVLSLGVISTPQVLMLSGIGPAKQLKDLNLPLFVDNPHVGQHLKGNVGFPGLIYAAIPPIMGGPVLNLPNGVLVTSAFRSAPGKNRTDLEVTVGCLRPDQDPAVAKLGLIVGAPVDVCLPLLIQNLVEVEGSVTPRSDNPLDQANVTYAMLQNSTNLLPLAKAFRMTRAAFANLPFLEISPGLTTVPLMMSDVDLAKALAESSQAEWHDVGTARMSRAQSTGVVDSRLRVWGVDGLRVVDSSVVPVAYSSHSAAAGAILVGAVGSRMIEEDNAKYRNDD
jgi:choline dehydrogenase